MPYFVNARVENLSFPSICPYCQLREADSIREFEKKQYTGLFVFLSTAIRHVFALPVCSRCKRSDRLRGIAALIVFALPFAIFPATESVGVRVFSWAGAWAVCLGMVLWRLWCQRRLRVTHTDGVEVTLATPSASYAERLAQVNGSQAERKILFFKAR